MKGISYLTDEGGHKKAVVIDLDLLRDRDNLQEIIEDLEDAISIELRKDEPSFDWTEVREALVNKD
ncbi:hypothetical protein [Dyadobacter sp. 32]|uniref:hypothetical protein n=1 Tax=Dyadobacter sp. 32 TaxID=538966 RepID=UPI0011F03133